MVKKEGRLLQGIGGFYYVETENGVVECKARGAFRKTGESPLAGDLVTIAVSEDGKGIVESIATRKNKLIRPPVANLDCLVMVCSVKDPDPNLPVLDKMIAIAEHKDIEPILVFNKTEQNS